MDFLSLNLKTHVGVSIWTYIRNGCQRVQCQQSNSFNKLYNLIKKVSGESGGGVEITCSTDNRTWLLVSQIVAYLSTKMIGSKYPWI